MLSKLKLIFISVLNYNLPKAGNISWIAQCNTGHARIEFTSQIICYLTCTIHCVIKYTHIDIIFLLFVKIVDMLLCFKCQNNQTLGHTDYYRLLVSPLCHNGIVHLVLVILVELVVGRHMEMVAGWHRMFFIYTIPAVFSLLVSKNLYHNLHFFTSTSLHQLTGMLQYLGALFSSTM